LTGRGQKGQKVAKKAYVIQREQRVGGKLYCKRPRA